MSRWRKDSNPSRITENTGMFLWKRENLEGSDNLHIAGELVDRRQLNFSYMASED